MWIKVVRTIQTLHGKQSNGKVLTDAIQLPKIPAIRANIHRDIVGKVSSITISRNAAGKYYASILADDGQEAAVKPTYITRMSGYDLGLSHYLIDNNVDKVANPCIWSTHTAVYAVAARRYPVKRWAAQTAVRLV